MDYRGKIHEIKAYGFSLAQPTVNDVILLHITILLDKALGCHSVV